MQDETGSRHSARSGDQCFDNGRPILWVGPAWQTSTRQEKESLARAAACFFLSGDESKPVKFSIYEQSSDREIAVWNLSRLVEW